MKLAEMRRMRRLIILMACASAMFGSLANAQRVRRGAIVYVPGSARKVCQLTGEFDRELKKRPPI